MNGFKKLFLHLLLHTKGAWSTEAVKVAALLFLRGKRKINTRVIGWNKPLTNLSIINKIFFFLCLWKKSITEIDLNASAVMHAQHRGGEKAACDGVSVEASTTAFVTRFGKFGENHAGIVSPAFPLEQKIVSFKYICTTGHTVCGLGLGSTIKRQDTGRPVTSGEAQILLFTSFY